MSKKEKLIKRLKSKPRDMTFQEIETLLLSLGFRLSNKGKTSGSASIFIYDSIKIKLHKPHGGKSFQPYQIAEVLNNLILGGFL